MKTTKTEITNARAYYANNEPAKAGDILAAMIKHAENPLGLSEPVRAQLLGALAWGEVAQANAEAAQNFENVTLDETRLIFAQTESEGK